MMHGADRLLTLEARHESVPQSLGVLRYADLYLMPASSRRRGGRASLALGRGGGGRGAKASRGRHGAEDRARGRGAQAVENFFLRVSLSGLHTPAPCLRLSLTNPGSTKPPTGASPAMTTAAATELDALRITARAAARELGRITMNPNAADCDVRAARRESEQADAALAAAVAQG